MKTLHLIGYSPDKFQQLTLEHQYRTEHDGLLFLQDSVYLLNANTQSASAIDSLPYPVFVLEDDVQARAISDKLLPSTQVISYDDMVKLCSQYDKTQSWF